MTRIEVLVAGGLLVGSLVARPFLAPSDTEAEMVAVPVAQIEQGLAVQQEQAVAIERLEDALINQQEVIQELVLEVTK